MRNKSTMWILAALVLGFVSGPGRNNRESAALREGTTAAPTDGAPPPPTEVTEEQRQLEPVSVR